jgi:hypothetical protein
VVRCPHHLGGYLASIKGRMSKHDLNIEGVKLADEISKRAKIRSLIIWFYKLPELTPNNEPCW